MVRLAEIMQLLLPVCSSEGCHQLTHAWTSRLVTQLPIVFQTSADFSGLAEQHFLGQLHGACSAARSCSEQILQRDKLYSTSRSAKGENQEESKKIRDWTELATNRVRLPDLKCCPNASGNDRKHASSWRIWDQHSSLRTVSQGECSLTETHAGKHQHLLLFTNISWSRKLL